MTSVLRRRRCDTLCTSGYTDDVIVAHNGCEVLADGVCPGERNRCFVEVDGGIPQAPDGQRCRAADRYRAVRLQRLTDDNLVI